MSLIAGDNFYVRRGNIISKSVEEDNVCWAIDVLKLEPRNVLEIGCADGWRLNNLFNQYKCKSTGIDPSMLAIGVGLQKYPYLKLEEGMASELPYDNNSFDTVIFGHCLYLCDNQDLFKIAYQADRVLAEDGHMIILDFYPKVPHYNINVDNYLTKTYKMDYSEMFSWHPSYTIVHRNIFVEKDNLAGDKVEVVVFKKQTN